MILATPDMVDAILKKPTSRLQRARPDQLRRRQEGSVLENGVVRTPRASRQLISNSSTAAGTRCRFDPSIGGQGLPVALASGGAGDVAVGQHGLRACARC